MEQIRPINTPSVNQKKDELQQKPAPESDPQESTEHEHRDQAPKKQQ
ncbi:hypothetical protein [Castellaniella caeni]|nr:hypothetical protein [Castellaniella caeni]